MKRVTPLLLVAAAFAACDDEPAKPASAPTAPSVVAPLAASASAAGVDLSGASTICRVYVTEREVAQTQVDSVPTDTLAQRRVKTLDALVKETCN